MRVLLAVHEEDDFEAWRAAFAAHLPEVALHPPTEAPAEVDYAIVWRPRPATFTDTRVRKAVFNLGAGVDALLALDTLPQSTPVFRLEDAGMAMQMAEYVTCAVLRAYRELDAYAQAQREALWRKRTRIAKNAFTVGLLGVGVLGRAVARALSTFGFPLVGYARSPRQVRDVQMWIGPGALPAFLAASRVLVCLLPSTPQTRNMLSRPLLSQLPRGAHLINVSRGDIVCDEDLLSLLDEGHLASATLDVFHTEPLPPEHRFWHHPRVTITPHVSAVTLVPEAAEQVVAKIRALERGVEPAGRVDRARGY
ncbi:MAG TPA: glyoxylate/hydroxypyruvate reductase A [Casimicrobiaceae bacterium]|nr:glyoxylate/hydroxypyruvate reductase A [Casimicrobiaceae bacterium]